MPFEKQSGVELLLLVIASGFYDIALDLIDRYPDVAKSSFEDSEGRRCALGEMAKKVSAFKSGSHLTSWERFIYRHVPLENYVKDHNGGDIEKPVSSSEVIAQKAMLGSFCISVRQKLYMLWNVLEKVPCLKRIRHKKLMHSQAINLVKRLCAKIGELKNEEAFISLTRDPLLVAANFGIHEIVEEIMDSFPWAIVASNFEDDNIFQIAVVNLFYQMDEYKQYVTRLEDSDGNILLHLVGRLAPPDKLNLIPGAALQMQRELQWFKEVEKFVNASYIEKRNDNGETASMVFTKQHKRLLSEGDKWMKDRATSCIIVTTLIAAIVFAAGITVPGGNNSTSGLPIFSNEKAFIVFAISDAISLFTSTTSLLIFLSILTSRYAEEDFLYSLPKRLIFGLVTLFLSITTMIIAFSSILYLMSGQHKEGILVIVVALACLPIFSFVLLQFHLLVDLISSTYGPGIFRKQSGRSFY